MGVVARVLVSSGLLVLLFTLLPAGQIWDVLRRFETWAWLGVLAGFLVGHRLGAEKWLLLLRTGGAPLHRRDAVGFYAGGLFANLYLPSIVGGDVLRATLAAGNVTRTEAVVVGSLADRIVDVAVLVVLMAAGGLVTGSVAEGAVGRVLLYGAIAGLGTVVLVLPVVLRMPLRRWPRRLRRPAGRCFVALRRLYRQPGPASVAFGLALVVQAGFVLLNAWIGAEVGIGVPLAAWFVVWPLAKVVALVPVSVGGLGVRDATLGALLVPLGVPMDLGVAASLVWQSVIVIGGLAAGAVWRLRTRTRQAPPSGRGEVSSKSASGGAGHV